MSKIPYTLIRSHRKTLSVQITPVGEVILRCPTGYPLAAAEDFLDAKAPWIEKHLSRISSAPETAPLTLEELHQLAAQASRDLPERAARFARQLGVDFGRVTIRSQHTRWGSCSARGNLNFNCLLMLCPEEIRDYVVIHELCHRKEMNHSPKFWAAVAEACPNYTACRKWLKEHAFVMQIF